MNTCKNIVPNTIIKLFDFLYKNTPSYSLWKINDCGWRVATFYIDDEDLWSGWYPQQHKDKYVKSYSYDEVTNIGIIEIMEVTSKCDNCNALTDYTVTTENRTYNVKGVSINADVQITICNKCGDEVFNREAEIENDKVIFGKYEKEIHDARD